MLDAFIAGLFHVLQWPQFGFMLLGIFVGIWIGVLPGIGGLAGLAILVPFTFGMDPVSAFAMLLGMLAVNATSDTLACVLLGIPGTAGAQATILDGYPLARQGQARRAFGAAFTVSAFGGVLGAFVLAVSLPLALPIILSVAKPEEFAFGILGLSMVGALAGSSIAKGLAAGAFGLLLSCVGYAEASSIPRYWFNIDYLLDGIPLLPLILGLFALPEMMELATTNQAISRVPDDQSKGGGMWQGVKDAWTHKWLALRTSIIGVYIGILPGLGNSIADWLSYGHSVQSAKDKSQFGRGDIRGVIGPEASNNAILGGSLIPLVAFGIPGGAGTAVLLGAFLIQGLRPGPEMLTTKLDFTFSLVWSIALANVIVVALLMVWSRQVARIAYLPAHYIVPGTMLFILLGAWQGATSIGDWIACLGFGVLGYVMKRGGWARPPVVLGLVLGALMENSFLISVRAYDGYTWLLRPIVLIIFAVAAVTIVLAARGIIKSRAAGEHLDDVGPDDAPGSGPEGSERNPLFSFPFAVLLALTFVFAAAYSFNWTRSVRNFPLFISIAGLIPVAVALALDWKSLRAEFARNGTFAAAVQAAGRKALFRESAIFFAQLAALIVVMMVIGMKLAITLYVFLYLFAWSKVALRPAIVYALGCWAILIAFYDRMLHQAWHPSLLHDWLGGTFPAWLPEWLFL